MYFKHMNIREKCILFFITKNINLSIKNHLIKNDHPVAVIRYF